MNHDVAIGGQTIATRWMGKFVRQDIWDCDNHGSPSLPTTWELGEYSQYHAVLVLYRIY